MPGFWGQKTQKSAAGSNSGGAYLRDYTHASKTFRTNSYENAPKLKFLFHTYFNINPEALNVQGNNNNFGLLVKEVKLPSFAIDTKELNQYNRKRLIYTKINYQEVSITFHDDNGDKINQLWEAYYNYYFNDGKYSKQVLSGNRGDSSFVAGNNEYDQKNIYEPSITGNTQWGLAGGGNAGSGKKVPFFKNITVFGFNQHNFTAYTLINPVVIDFTHDTYNYGENNGVMTNRMTLKYEAVAYNYGAIDGRDPSDIVIGFGDPSNYDNTPSPITQAGSNGNILGNGGLVDGAGGTVQSQRNGMMKNQNNTVRQIGYNVFKTPNLTNTETSALNAMLRNNIQNTPLTRNSSFFFPVAGSSPGPIGSAGYPTIGASGTQPSSTAGFQNNGSYYSGGYKNSQGVVTDFPFNPTNPPTYNV